MDAALSDVVDSALHSMHQSSERSLPAIQDLLAGLPAQHRQETLCWLLQAFDVMSFPDTLLFDAALILDRYYATMPVDEGPGGAQQKLLAAVCTALKIGYPADLQLPLKQVVTHLGRDQVPFEQVMLAELTMLRTLEFHVGTPTARDFLEALCARLSTSAIVGSMTWRSLAEFLLQLTLSDAQLHFGHVHSILAASCVALALWAVRAPQSAFEVLLDDFELTGAGDHGCLTRCCSDVHRMWTRTLPGGPEQSAYARHLRDKFEKAGNHAVVALVPPAAPPSRIPPAQAWGTPAHRSHSAAVDQTRVSRQAAPARGDRGMVQLRVHSQARARSSSGGGGSGEEPRPRRAASWGGGRGPRTVPARSQSQTPPR